MAGQVTPKFGSKRDPSMRNQSNTAKALMVATPAAKGGTGVSGPSGAKVAPAFGGKPQRMVMGPAGGGSGLATSPAGARPNRTRRKAKMV